MVSLALVLELHHPLPGPGEAVGAGWASTAIECDWPVLRAVSRFAEKGSGGALTLAISPSWTALASDASARMLLLTELNRRESVAAGESSLRRFLIDRWDGDAVALVRDLAGSGAVDVIPMTSSHSWLPSVTHDPVVARAQICLAAADHARRLGSRPSGIWLPFLSYRPGLESIMGEAGLRFFGVGSDEFLKGTILPPAQVFGPMVTPSGVAVFGVSPDPSRPVVDPEVGLRPRRSLPRSHAGRRGRGRPRPSFPDGLERLCLGRVEGARRHHEADLGGSPGRPRFGASLAAWRGGRVAGTSPGPDVGHGRSGRGLAAGLPRPSSDWGSGPAGAKRGRFSLRVPTAPTCSTAAGPRPICSPSPWSIAGLKRPRSPLRGPHDPVSAQGAAGGLVASSRSWHRCRHRTPARLGAPRPLLRARRFAHGGPP